LARPKPENKEHLDWAHAVPKLDLIGTSRLDLLVVEKVVAALRFAVERQFGRDVFPKFPRQFENLAGVAALEFLPYEPGYVANKEADKRRKETKERLQQREREFAERQQPPSIVPERHRASSVGGFVTVEVSKSAHTAQASA
jgi:hypothetical protein